MTTRIELGPTMGADDALLRYRRVALGVKRLADIVGAAIGLLVTGPFLLLLAWLIRRDSPGPGFFKQERVGQYGKPFVMWKLRTMVEKAERMGAGIAVEPNDPRITRIGRWLRNTSIDELPQLWNILRGDMSFVGPRPLFPSWVDKWTPRQRKRLLMPQGLTGWVQVQGRNNTPWDQRFEMDVWYVENWSLWLDLKIMFRTIGAVLSQRGVYSDDGSVPPFEQPSSPTADVNPPLDQPEQEPQSRRQHPLFSSSGLMDGQDGTRRTNGSQANV